IKPEEKVKTPVNKSDDDEEYSEFKDKRGNYRFTAQQRANRVKAIEKHKIKEQIEAEKQKKKRYYEEIANRKKSAVKSTTSKKVKPKSTAVRTKKQEKPAEKPTSLWGKFLY